MLSAEWCEHSFDHISPELAQNLHETLATMRADHPVAYSEEHGGFWVVTRYEDVLRVAQDWRTFSSARGVSVPETKMVVKAIPEHLDPPLHREYKRLINAWFTPAVVAEYEVPTRAVVTRLLDEFVESGPQIGDHPLARMHRNAGTLVLESVRRRGTLQAYGSPRQ